MTYHYQIGATRWKRHDSKCDVRLSTPPKGWVRYAYQIDRHPITNKPFKGGLQWWFRDVFEGSQL